MTSYDAILLGTGQATGSLVSELTSMGMSVAVIESDRVGGTCVNWGCTPTKTMVASARAAHVARRAADYGVNTGEVRVDFATVMERRDSIRNGNTEGFEAYLADATDLYRGHGRFVGPKEIEVGSHTLTAERIFIHTGARARLPDIPGIDNARVLDNKSLLALSELPEHLIIVGGSYVGLEFGQIFARLGSRVTVLERGRRLVPREDADVAGELQRILENDGIDIRCGSQVHSIHAADSGVRADGVRSTEQFSIEGSHILFAIGRVPNTDDLGLDAAGIETDDRGFIRVNNQLETNVPGVYAIGDVNGRGAFTHTSVHDGQVVTGTLRGESWSITERTPIYALYTDPPLGRVGLSETQAAEQYENVLTASRPMSKIARAIEKDETDGIVKFVVDGDSERILGAAILGVGGDEVINMVAGWIGADRPYHEFQRIVLTHPTVAELMPWILNDLAPSTS